jgi:hypothetical protein
MADIVPAAYRFAFEAWNPPDRPYGDPRVMFLTLRLYGIDLPLTRSETEAAGALLFVSGGTPRQALEAIWGGVEHPDIRMPVAGAALPIPPEWYGLN